MNYSIKCHAYKSDLKLRVFCFGQDGQEIPVICNIEVFLFTKTMIPNFRTENTYHIRVKIYRFIQNPLSKQD